MRAKATNPQNKAGTVQEIRPVARRGATQTQEMRPCAMPFRICTTTWAGWHWLCIKMCWIALLDLYQHRLDGLGFMSNMRYACGTKYDFVMLATRRSVYIFIPNQKCIQFFGVQQKSIHFRPKVYTFLGKRVYTLSPKVYTLLGKSVCTFASPKQKCIHFRVLVGCKFTSIGCKFTPIGCKFTLKIYTSRDITLHPRRGCKGSQHVNCKFTPIGSIRQHNSGGGGSRL